MNIDRDDETVDMIIGKGHSTTIPRISFKLIRSTALCLLLGLLGWFYCHHLIDNESTIQLKEAPFQQLKSGEIILDFSLNHPLIDPPTISSSLLIWTSIFLPISLVTGHLIWFGHKKKRVEYIMAAVGGFSMAIGLSEGATVLLKLWIQRRRPNFYSLCAFDTSLKKCTAELKFLREANYSFPSGHSSLSSCGMTFIVWYFLGNQINQRPFANAMIVLIPFSWTLFVAGSRIVDKWHHPSDVLAGLSLGFTTCTIAYHTWYPPIWSTKFAGVPRSLCNANEHGNNKLPSFNR